MYCRDLLKIIRVVLSWSKNMIRSFYLEDQFCWKAGFSLGFNLSPNEYNVANTKGASCPCFIFKLSVPFSAFFINNLKKFSLMGKKRKHVVHVVKHILSLSRNLDHCIRFCNIKRKREFTKFCCYGAYNVCTINRGCIPSI